MTQSTTTEVELDSVDIPMIVDPELLFRYSGMLDSLRDSSKILYRGGVPSAATVDMYTKQYQQLRGALKTTVRPDVAEDLERFTIELSDTSAGIDGVYAASAQLAQFIDVIHQTPDWMLSQRVREVNALQVQEQIAQANPNKEKRPSVLHFGMMV